MPEADLALLIAAAREAGSIATRYWSGDNTVWEKGHDDPVSEADHAVDAFLRETLRAARPAYGWLSEETEDDPGRLGRTRTFIADPIDGTRAFIKGEKTWAHSIAVVENGQPTAGVVYLPLLDKLYAATRGGGATLNAAPLRVAAPGTPPRVLASRPAFAAEHWTGGVPDVERHFRPSLAYRLCLVGEGRFDAMLTLRRSWEWDIAAGALIAAEAGAVATDRKGQEIRFNRPHPMADGVLVAEAGVHDLLLSRLAR